MTVNDILKAVPELKFTELQAYLRNTGWARIETPKQSIALFQKQIGSNFFETLLPLSKDYSDYSYRIIDVLEAIASAENREVDQVLTDLSIPPGVENENEFKIGDKVTYKNNFCPVEHGIVKETVNSDGDIKVVYKCNNDWKNWMNYTGELTSKRHLTKGWNRKTIKLNLKTTYEKNNTNTSSS